MSLSSTFHILHSARDPTKRLSVRKILKKSFRLLNTLFNSHILPRRITHRVYNLRPLFPRTTKLRKDASLFTVVKTSPATGRSFIYVRGARIVSFVFSPVRKHRKYTLRGRGRLVKQPPQRVQCRSVGGRGEIYRVIFNKIPGSDRNNG